MIRRVIGSVLASSAGRKVARERGKSPVAGAVIGAGAMYAARRLLPQRFALLAATVAAGYLTKKWAERAERRQAAEQAHAADPDLAAAAVVDAYVGADAAPSDGQHIGDALPPAIPVDEQGKVVH